MPPETLHNEFGRPSNGRPGCALKRLEARPSGKQLATSESYLVNKKGGVRPPARPRRRRSRRPRGRAA